MKRKSNALVGGIFLGMKITKSFRIDKAEVRALARLGAVVLSLSTTPVYAQLIDKTLAPNIANEGINKSLADQIGAGRGDWSTPNSSSFIISRDPFRSIRRGRQLFQRKFTREQANGPIAGDGKGDVNSALAIGAGLSDSCAGCHGRPRGAAGFGGDVATRPDSRDAPHLFGLGLKEILADEITSELRAIRANAVAKATTTGEPVKKQLISKRIRYGNIIANPDGSVDTSGVRGVNPDLRVRPFFAHGGKIAIREFIVGALNDEMGLQAPDSDLATAVAGGKVTTPSGMVLDGSTDQFAAPPTSDPNADPDGDGMANEIPSSLVDHLEFYLLNYFKPATYQQTASTKHGRKLFDQIGCASCHIPDLEIRHDRRVADVETVFDPVNGIFNGLFATAALLHDVVDDGKGFPPVKPPKGGPFLVKNIFTDFKRHDLGPSFHERNYDGTTQKEFMTTPLWGVGSTPPYGHDGRSINLAEAILRHGGEAQKQAEAFEKLSDPDQSALLDFLNSLVIFPPDDTASNLNPGNRNDPNFPQSGHGNIKLAVLFNDPMDLE
jgi:mono/diheme cytochrome c family protein